MEDSSPRTPLVFILSPGVDPTSALLQLAEHTGMAQRFHSLSLGQGQAPIAARLLREGMYQGQWHSCSSKPILDPGPTHQSSSLDHTTITTAPTFPEGLQSGRPEHFDTLPHTYTMRWTVWGQMGVRSGSY